jgi:pimeloyl-ACP methyl ester carboxylesterase
VYLHGMCADPREDLEAWGGLAGQYGTVVALAGDTPCGPDKPSGRTSWTSDVEAIDRRIVEALSIVNGSALAPPLDASEVVLIGESMGAARAEALARKFDQRYRRLVLVGSPQVPSAQNLGRARAVATLAGELEGQEKMKQGARVLEQAGLRTQFWELPGATHGRYGPDGERVMSQAVAFVTAP